MQNDEAPDEARGRSADNSGQAWVSDQHAELFHYTSVSALKGILESNSLWATNAMQLNDSSELQLMWESIARPILKCYETEVERFGRRESWLGKMIQAAGGAARIAASDGPTMVQVLRSEVLEDVIFFIASFTTHSGGEHDEYHIDHGMLSQWRGYAGDQGVAIVFDTARLEKLLRAECDLLDYWPELFEPAFYVTTEKALEDHFPDLFESIHEFIRAFIQNPRNQDANGPTYEKMLRFVRECGKVLPRLKHRGFHEESECRIVLGLKSEFLREKMRNTGLVDSEPAKAIHLRNHGGDPILYIRLFEDSGQDLPINRIIIGPSRDQDANLKTVQDLVRGRGIKVQRSGTPYVGTVEPAVEDPANEPLLPELQQIALQMERSGSILHMDRKFQAALELSWCNAFKEAFNRQNKARITGVENNPDQDDENKSFPDCFALLGNKPIGLEVTAAIKETRAAADNQHSAELAERVEEVIQCIVAKKDKKARIPGRKAAMAKLHELILLICVEQPIAPTSEFGKFLYDLRIARPKRIDRVFLVAPPMPSDTPVIRRNKYGPITEREKERKIYGLFEIRFLGILDVLRGALRMALAQCCRKFTEVSKGNT